MDSPHWQHLTTNVKSRTAATITMITSSTENPILISAAKAYNIVKQWQNWDLSYSIHKIDNNPKLSYL